MLLMPLLLKRFTVSRIIFFGAIISIVGYALNFFAGANTTLLMIAGALTAGLTLPVSYLTAVLLMDLFNYNEYKGLARLEGTTNQLAHGVSSQIGQGVGGFLLGVFLDLGGYIAVEDGAAVTQPESAIAMIRALYSIIPIIMVVILIVCVFFLGKLDKEMPQIEAAIQARHGSTESAE